MNILRDQFYERIEVKVDEDKTCSCGNVKHILPETAVEVKKLAEWAYTEGRRQMYLDITERAKTAYYEPSA